MAELVAMLSEHEGQDVRRRDPRHGVWDVREPGLLARKRKVRLATLAACRSALWRALLSHVPNVFIRHDDSPTDSEVPGSWQHEGKHTWRIPAGFDPTEPRSASWLDPGGWLAYAAPAPVHDRGGLLGQAPERVVGWAQDHGIVFAIESDFDDLEWRVLVPEETP